VRSRPNVPSFVALLALLSCGEAASNGGPQGAAGNAGQAPGAGTGGTGGAGAAGAGGGGTAGSGVGGSPAGGAGATGGAGGAGTGGGPDAGAAGLGEGGEGSIAGAGGSGGSSGAAGSAGTAGGAGLDGGCSETVLRTGPPAGRESYRTDPIDDRFPFASHWVGEFSSDPVAVGMTSLADLDQDGDLDFGLGQRQDRDGGMAWFEYCTQDHWVLHSIGGGYTTWAGGGAADLDGDGLMDLIAGDSWFKNPGDARSAPSWERLPIASDQSTAPRPEEIIVGELTGDDRPDVVFAHRQVTPQFWSPAAGAPDQAWVRTLLTDESCSSDTICPQQGAAIGDLDGDGDPDVLDGYRRWYENTDGDGSAWATVTILTDGAFDASPLTALGDLDGDGDLDIVMGTHFGARLSWAENDGNEGRDFSLHPLSDDKDYLHTIIAADLDNDGDLDILAGQNVGPTFVFENDGTGAFAEHTIAADTRGHEARVGDVDCDGDLDIVGNPWGDQNEGGEESEPVRDVAYLESLVVDRGGPAIFARGEGEVTPSVHARRCPGQ